MSARAQPVVTMLVLCGALALHNVMRTGPVTLVEELRARYGVADAAVGSVIGAYALSYGVAQLVAGLLTRRFGEKGLLLVGLALATAGSAVFAVTSAYSLAVGARLLMGAAGGFLYTPALAYTFAAFGRTRRGRAMGIAQVGVAVGQTLALWGLPVLFRAVGLLRAFLAIPALAAGLAVAVLRGLPAMEQDRGAASGRLRVLLGHRDFWLLLGGYAFVGMLADGAVLAWLPTYLRRAHGFGVVAAGIGTGVVVTGLAAFSPLFGALSDRLTARRPVMLGGAVLSLVAWLTLLTTGSPAVALAGAFLVSASMAATIPMQAVFASERFAAVGAGAAIGLVNAGGQIASSLGAPLYGAMLDHGLGFRTVWGVAAALATVRVLVVLCLREPRPARPAGGPGPD